MCLLCLILIDFLSGENESRQNNGDAGSKNCICNGPQCICCLDFNISFIDLGGPGNFINFYFSFFNNSIKKTIFLILRIGCVRLKYLSAEEGIAINVSYGESLLHNEIAKGPDPAPTCLNIFAKLAQMCARFTGLLPTDDGMRGCVRLEPMLLGEPQLELPIGCFRMGPHGMEVIQSPQEVIQEQNPATELDKDVNSTAGSDEVLDGITAADILTVVNESAEQGIALLTNWLGLAPNATAEEAATADPAQNSIKPVTNNGNQKPQDQNNGHIVFGS